MIALVAAAALACPHDASLGTVAFTRGTTLHRLSLADCRERSTRLRGTGAGASYGVVARGHALWLPRGGRLVRLTRPLPADEWPEPVALSPDRRWVVWQQAIRSASLSADGRPLKVTRLAPGGATRPLAPAALGYPDYLAWCGSSFVFVAGGNRQATWNKRLLVARAPDWRPRPLWRDPRRAFGSVACAPDGRSVAVLSQPASDDAAFFDTRWQLWRVALDGSRTPLDRPPPGSADESPRFGPGGALFFVRERQGRGTLMLLGTGPLARLGYSLGYYGHHDWPYSVG